MVNIESRLDFLQFDPGTFDFLLDSNASVFDAVKLLNKNEYHLVVVVTGSRTVCGTVSDGDIRRFILLGGELNQPVSAVTRKDFRFVSAKSTVDDAMSILTKHNLSVVPLLDDQNRLDGIYFLRRSDRKMLANPVVIMAGGIGKRLYPLTQDCPKPMLRIGGKPLLEIILEQCCNAGFQNFYFSVNYLKDMIQDYFGDGTRWHVRIDYLEETQPLGTAGALSLLPNKPTEPILVLNGDVLTRVDYNQLLKFHNEQRSAATLCVREHVTQIPYGVVRLDDLHVLSFEEKPVLSHYVNAGIYLLDPVLLDLIPKNRFFHMPTLLENAIDHDHRVSAFPVHEYWLDIGQPETFERAHGEWPQHDR